MKVNDPVEIIGNCIAELQPMITDKTLGYGWIAKTFPQYGRITKIDGGYIYVKPKYRRFECECYSVELRVMTNEEYKTVRNYKRL